MNVITGRDGEWFKRRLKVKRIAEPHTSLTNTALRVGMGGLKIPKIDKREACMKLKETEESIKGRKDEN